MQGPESHYQYQAIARILKEQILRGDFEHRGRLPSERALGERFKVQRNTVRQALSLLEREGQISTEGKRGSFIKFSAASTSAIGKAFLVNIHGGNSPNLTQLRDGFSRASSEAGYSVQLFDSHPAEGAALDPIPDADTLSPEIAGAVIWPQNPTNVDALRRLKSVIPLVLVDRRVIGLSADCVRFGDLEGGRMVADHLIAQGHRKIGFISDDVFAETVQQRWRGYVLAHEERGLPVDRRLTMFFHGIDASFFPMAMRHCLSQGPDAPTAIVCSNDVVAFSLLRFLHDEGIRVPDDLAVTGYGNVLPAYGNAMGLTSVDQPFLELGRAAAHILVNRVGQVPAEWAKAPHDIEIPVSLIVRGSSGSNRASVEKAT